MTRIFAILLVAAVSGVLALFWLAADMRAATDREIASPWSDGLNSRVRLIAGTAGERDEARYAGVEITLEDGWKTYWRNPGDAGIPPVFDWSGSENLASAQVLYPLPGRLDDPAGTSIGYKTGVVFPVRITAKEKGKPVHLDLKLNYAVCETLCIPADAEMFLAVPAGPDGMAPSPAIARGLAQVPRPAGDGPPRVTKVSLEGEGKTRHLALSVDHDSGAAAPELFVEGPQVWYLGVPEEVARSAGADILTVTYAVPVRGKGDAQEMTGATLRATISSGGRAVEQSVTLP